MKLIAVKETLVLSNEEIAIFIGKMFSFNNSLKLYHWHVTEKGSYAQHIATDQAFESLSGITDRIVETSYAAFGNLDIDIPLTIRPEKIIEHCEEFYDMVESNRELFSEIFFQSILDEYQEAIQQLLYRLKRLQ